MTNEQENDQLRLVKESISSELDFLKRRLGDAISTLPPREREVLKMRFGPEDDALTQGEISLFFNVSPKRVRQIEIRALRRLRHKNQSPHQ